MLIDWWASICVGLITPKEQIAIPKKTLSWAPSHPHRRKEFIP